jgi:hypothetical protein
MTTHVSPKDEWPGMRQLLLMGIEINVWLFGIVTVISGVVYLAILRGAFPPQSLLHGVVLFIALVVLMVFAIKIFDGIIRYFEIRALYRTASQFLDP